MSRTPTDRRARYEHLDDEHRDDLSARQHASVQQSSLSDGAQPESRELPSNWPWVGASAGVLLQGLLFGLIFGFLLQKGGVAKFDILLGVLLLEDFTVIKVMGTAVAVGMIGVYFLSRAGVIQLQVKETVYSANIVGGLIFGVGFGLLAYCPGTNAAALGQGNLDAISGILGLALGSYLFALNARFTQSPDGTVTQKGARGKLTLPGLVGMSRGAFVLIAIPVLVGVLVLIELVLP